MQRSTLAHLIGETMRRIDSESKKTPASDKRPLRTDIERVLDELIAEKQAFKFQSLGVVLAKQKWARLSPASADTTSGLMRTREVVFNLTEEVWAWPAR